MAEIASAFPTAGGLYYWASKLGSPGWGWATGWFNLIGQIAVTACDRLRPGDLRRRCCSTTGSTTGAHERLVRLLYNASIYVLYAIFLAAAAIVNMFQVSITAMLNTVSAYWHMAGVAFIVLVLIIVPDHHQSFGYVFGETVNNSGYGSATTTSQHRRSGSSSDSGSCSRSTRSRASTPPRTWPRRRTRRRAWRRSACTCRSSSRSCSAGSCCSPSRSRSRAPRARSTTSAPWCRGSGRSR